MAPFQILELQRKKYKCTSYFRWENKNGQRTLISSVGAFCHISYSFKTRSPETQIDRTTYHKPSHHCRHHQCSRNRFKLWTTLPFLSAISSVHSTTEAPVYEIDLESTFWIPLWQEENKNPFYESLTEYCYGNNHNSELLKQFLMGCIYTDKLVHGFKTDRNV